MAAVDFPGLTDLQERLAVMLLSCPRPLTTREAYERLADEFELTRELLRREHDNGDSEWHILVRTAYKHLKDLGYAPNPPPVGRWRLNQAGRAYAEKVERAS
jgi:hypothetical protein